MAKSADAADLKSAGDYPPWGFKSPSGHHKTKELHVNWPLENERPKSFGGCSGGCWFLLCHRVAVLRFSALQ
jgi:hypothetical protein